MRDTRHALRRLARDWRFAVAAVSILGLGIGANTAIFSLINGTIFRQQSLADPDRLVDIYQNAANPGGVDANSYPAYLDMAAYTDVFASTTTMFVPRGVNYLDEGVLRPAIVEHTSATYPSVLGLRPSLGRWFDAAEDISGASVVAVVGHEAWTRKFRADRSVIGRTIRIEGVPVTIVGADPAGHRGSINIGIVTDFWLPISSLTMLGAPLRMLERRPEEAAFFVKARLRDGVTVAQAQAAMGILGSRLASEYPQEDLGKGIAVFASSDVRIHPQMDGPLAAVARCCLSSSGSCWRSRAATWRRCCSCAVPPVQRKCRSDWPWARRAGSLFVTSRCSAQPARSASALRSKVSQCSKRMRAMPATLPRMRETCPRRFDAGLGRFLVCNPQC